MGSSGLAYSNKFMFKQATPNDLIKGEIDLGFQLFDIMLFWKLNIALTPVIKHFSRRLSSKAFWLSTICDRRMQKRIITIKKGRYVWRTLVYKY